MKNKNFAKIIAMSLLATMAVNTGAVGNIEMRGEDYYYDNIHSNPVYNLGTPEDETGVLLPDSGVSVASATSETELFSMTANGVTGLLTTRWSNKSFSLSDLDEYQYINGTLNNTYTQDYVTMKVGACYYNAYTTTYVAVTSDYFMSGEDSESMWWPSDDFFSDDVEYLGYINNYSGLGSVSGTITYYTGN